MAVHEALSLFGDSASSTDLVGHYAGTPGLPVMQR
jgi:hypothetical protein